MLLLAILVGVIVTGVLTFLQLQGQDDAIDTNREAICATGQIIPAPQVESESDQAYLKRLNSYALPRALLEDINCDTVIKAVFKNRPQTIKSREPSASAGATDAAPAAQSETGPPATVITPGETGPRGKQGIPGEDGDQRQTSPPTSSAAPCAVQAELLGLCIRN